MIVSYILSCIDPVSMGNPMSANTEESDISWGRPGGFGYTVYCRFFNRVYGIFTLFSGIWDT